MLKYSFTLSKTFKSPIQEYECSSFLEFLETIAQFSFENEIKFCFLTIQNLKDFCIVCKLYTKDNTVFKELIKNEIFTLQTLTCFIPERIRHFYQQLSIPSIQKEYTLKHSTSSFLFTKCITLNNEIRTFRNFIQSLDCEDIQFRSCLFQILISLRFLQKQIPGFRHNDFKTDNILCRNGNSFTKMHIILDNKRVRYFSVPTSVQTVLIDFENAWWIGKSSLNFKKEFKEDLQLKFGIYEKECIAFDIHLLCMDILKCSSNDLYMEDFKIFLNDFIKPFYFNPTSMTSESRLREEYQTNFIKNIDSLLLHPYFYSFRCNESLHSIEF